MTTPATSPPTPAERAGFIRARIPAGGLFAGQDWRISPAPFPLGRELAASLESLGRVLLQFNRAVNLLYRQSLAGKQPPWVAQWLDQGKPPQLLEIQRSAALKAELPRVIRPDIILNESGPCITELDSVPGGIGLTAWLNQTYSALPLAAPGILGGADGMIRGFAVIFGEAKSVHIVISEEAQTYRPEMDWLAAQLGDRFHVRDTRFTQFENGDAVYRFFELFDLPGVPSAKTIMEMALDGKIRLTPPPRPIFEEKMLFALLWNRNLRPFWRQELGEGFLDRLQQLVPYTWMVDPSPLPPQGAIPGIELDRLDPAQVPFPARPRVDSQNLRLLRKGLGRARRLSRQRSFHRRLERRRGRGHPVLSAVALCITALPQAPPGGVALV